MTRAPETFTAGLLVGRRVASHDLVFAKTLFSKPELSTHKPIPVPPSPEQITKANIADLAHWEARGFGRYVVEVEGSQIGFCGLNLRGGMEGLNLSYHLSPDHWGQGHATVLVQAMVDVAATNLPGHGLVYGLVRPTNPASARVLIKAGFTHAEDLSLGGAPTTRYTRAI